MKPVFICQLSEEAQADIKNRLETLKNTFLEMKDEDVETAMDDKIVNVIPNIEWQEWIHYDLDLYVYVDDDIIHQHMLDEYSRYQELRRKKYGYDYIV